MTDFATLDAVESLAENTFPLIGDVRPTILPVAGRDLKLDGSSYRRVTYPALAAGFPIAAKFDVSPAKHPSAAGETSALASNRLIKVHAISSQNAIMFVKDRGMYRSVQKGLSAWSNMTISGVASTAFPSDVVRSPTGAMYDTFVSFPTGLYRSSGGASWTDARIGPSGSAKLPTSASKFFVAPGKMMLSAVGDQGTMFGKSVTSGGTWTAEQLPQDLAPPTAAWYKHTLASEYFDGTNYWDNGSDSGYESRFDAEFQRAEAALCAFDGDEEFVIVFEHYLTPSYTVTGNLSGNEYQRVPADVVTFALYARPNATSPWTRKPIAGPAAGYAVQTARAHTKLEKVRDNRWAFALQTYAPTFLSNQPMVQVYTFESSKKETWTNRYTKRWDPNTAGPEFFMAHGMGTTLFGWGTIYSSDSVLNRTTDGFDTYSVQPADSLPGLGVGNLNYVRDASFDTNGQQWLVAGTELTYVCADHQFTLPSPEPLGTGVNAIPYYVRAK